MIHPSNSHAVNPHYGRRRGNLGMPDPSKYPDWTPGDRDPRLIGMPDPSKYPDWKPGHRDPHIIGMPDPSKYPDYNKERRDSDPNIMGGWDSPMFHNGRVITRREFAELSDLGLA